jgi:hypothetical protein
LIHIWLKLFHVSEIKRTKMKIHDDDTDKTSRQGAGDKENEATPTPERSSVSRQSMSDNDPPVIIDGGKSAS